MLYTKIGRKVAKSGLSVVTNLVVGMLSDPPCGNKPAKNIYPNQRAIDLVGLSTTALEMQ